MQTCAFSFLKDLIKVSFGSVRGGPRRLCSEVSEVGTCFLLFGDGAPGRGGGPCLGKCLLAPENMSNVAVIYLRTCAEWDAVDLWAFWQNMFICSC